MLKSTQGDWLTFHAPSGISQSQSTNRDTSHQKQVISVTNLRCQVFREHTKRNKIPWTQTDIPFSTDNKNHTPMTLNVRSTSCLQSCSDRVTLKQLSRHAGVFRSGLLSYRNAGHPATDAGKSCACQHYFHNQQPNTAKKLIKIIPGKNWTMQPGIQT